MRVQFFRSFEYHIFNVCSKYILCIQIKATGHKKDNDGVFLVVFSNDSDDHSRNPQFPGWQNGPVFVVSRLEIRFPLVETVLPDDEIVVDDSQHDISQHRGSSSFDDQLISVDNPEVPHARSLHRMQYGNRRMLHDIIGKPQLPYPGLVQTGNFGHESYVVVHFLELIICT